MQKDHIKDFDRLNKECFWEYQFDEKDILHILNEGTFAEKLFLYEKILANSTDLLNDMELFSLEDLQRLTEYYKIPTFNKEYLKRRKNILECYFFNKPLEVEELKWVA